MYTLEVILFRMFNAMNSFFRLSLSIVFASLFFGLTTFGATLVDEQIVDAINQQQQEELLKQAQTLNETITFTQVNSCQSMEQVFSNFLEIYKKYTPQQSYRGRGAFDIMYTMTKMADLPTENSTEQTLVTAPIAA
ncbi:MAG: hypothetical protein LBG59_08240 [Candidatus Peribacteria bacterium]|jgi:hypothetical protein|nr:hypothetical protein [Candidatus Peribacteria bacterium]